MGGYVSTFAVWFVGRESPLHTHIDLVEFILRRGDTWITLEDGYIVNTGNILTWKKIDDDEQNTTGDKK